MYVCNGAVRGNTEQAQAQAALWRRRNVYLASSSSQPARMSLSKHWPRCPAHITWCSSVELGGRGRTEARRGIRRDRDAEGVEEMGMGRDAPSCLGGLGNVASSSNGVRAEPRPTRCFGAFWAFKKPMYWQGNFSIFQHFVTHKNCLSSRKWVLVHFHL